MTTSSIPTPTSTSTSTRTARMLSAERERHRAAFAAQGDASSQKRFALPDPASPDYESSMHALEGELDRAIAALDQQDKAEDRADANRQLAEAEDDPAPLSNYKRAEAIKQNTPS